MKMNKLPSEANLRKGDLSGEGRLGENRELMDKNRIEPERSGDSLPAKRCRQRRQGASRWHNTPKASGMPLEVNPAAVRWSNVSLPGEASPVSKAGEESAEAIVAGRTSRSADEHSKDAGGLNPVKGRTNEEGIDPAMDGPTDDARRRGETESHRGESRSAAETARRATMEPLKNEP
jgi:hypothetical protein